METNKIIKTIMESNTIGITFHVSPDGDAIGSSLALYKALIKIGKEVYILCDEEFPEDFKFLSGFENFDKNRKLSNDFDLVIVLDCGNKERICTNIDFLAPYKIINIDHHKSNDFYGHINYVDTKAAALGEIIFKIVNDLNIPIDKEIAPCLYTSILTDTGGFRFSNTTSNTLRVISTLLEGNSFDFSDIYRRIYSSKEFKRIKLFGKVIEGMKLCLDGKGVLMTVTLDMLRELDIELQDSSDIVNIGMEIDSIDVGILIKETQNGLKVSLRSKYLVDVSKVAETFNGGGHKRAAGLILNTTFEEGEKLLIEALEKELYAGNN